MVQLLEKFIPLRPPVEDRVSMLLAQIPSRLRYRNYFYTLVDPRGQWSAVEQILRMVARGQDQAAWSVAHAGGGGDHFRRVDAGRAALRNGAKA